MTAGRLETAAFFAAHIQLQIFAIADYRRRYPVLPLQIGQ